MERGMECTVCNKIVQPTKDIKIPCTPCDSCRNLICNECSELSASEIKCLSLRTRLLRFICKKCRNHELLNYLEKTIQDKEQIINDKNEIIKMLQEKLKQCEDKITNFTQTSYANITMSNEIGISQKRGNHPNVIIKPNTVQDGKKTKLDLDKNINPTQLRVGIKQMKTTKKGSIIITCQTKEETDVLEKAVKESLGNNYSVEQTKMRNPKIKIINFNQNLTADEINISIAEQNNLSGNVRTTYIKKTKNGLSTVYCECTGATFKQIMAGKKICIGWERYPVYEDLDVPRCFNCQGFYHKKQDCRNKLVCSVCSEEHHESTCSKQRKCCQNCVTSNEKYKTDYNVEHSASDMQCPCLEYYKSVLRSKTDYSSL